MRLANRASWFERFHWILMFRNFPVSRAVIGLFFMSGLPYLEETTHIFGLNAKSSLVYYRNKFFRRKVIAATFIRGIIKILVVFGDGEEY